MANRTVLIPGETDPFVVKINNDVYSYPAGTEQEVPDEVADLIDNYWELQPKQAKAVDGGMLPYVTKANDGDVLKVKDGAWQAGKDETGGGSDWTPDITITATLGSWGGDTENFNYISAIDKTTEECQAAITALNKKVLLNIDDDGYVATYYMRVCSLWHDQQAKVSGFMLMPDPDYYGYTVLMITTDNLPLNNIPIRVMAGSSGVSIFSWDFSNVPKQRYLAYGDLIFGSIVQPE